MSNREPITECGTDVLVSFTESLHIYSGLLTVATVCGGLSGLLAAALLYIYCLKHLLLTRQVSESHKAWIPSRSSNVWCVYPLASWQGHNARRLLDPDDGAVDNNPSDCVSNSRKEPASGTDDKVVMLNLR